MKCCSVILFSLYINTFLFSQVEDHSFLVNGERILTNSFEVDAPLQKVWNAYSTEEDFRLWAAPVVAIDWRIGGSVKASFKEGGVIGDETTSVSSIVYILPEKQIILKENLLELLEMGIKFQWLKNIPEEFLQGLRDKGSDIHTSIWFERINDSRTKITFYITGYGQGNYWDTTAKDAIEANNWSAGRLIKFLESN